jgi:hypothetical protein
VRPFLVEYAHRVLMAIYVDSGKCSLDQPRTQIIHSKLQPYAIRPPSSTLASSSSLPAKSASILVSSDSIADCLSYDSSEYTVGLQKEGIYSYNSNLCIIRYSTNDDSLRMN